MKRLVPATIAAVLTVGTFLGVVYAAGSFNQKLSPNQQIIHALNRLTYGPHPGDVEEVRRIGLAKWIELQLHPDQIPENPVLEAKLKPLATLNMSMADVVREYTPRPEEANRNDDPLRSVEYEFDPFARSGPQGHERHCRRAD